MSPNLLALDQSTDVTGWALFINGELIEYGHLTPKGEYLDRIVQLRAWVKFYIEEYNKDIRVAIEDIQLQNIPGSAQTQNVVTYKKLAHAQGVLLELLTEMGIQYEVVASSSWKSSFGIKGKARAEQKRNAQKYVLDTLGIKPTQDETDAICIGMHILKQDSESFNWD